MASSSNSNSPCAACKFLRRKCTQGCVFAPYFPADQPQKFSFVHKVFGASNVAKILNELNPSYREDAVNSLAYEAEARLRDPIYGCVGYISLLQQKLKQLQHDVFNAKKELSGYIGPSAMSPFIAHTHPHQLMNPHAQVFQHPGYQASLHAGAPSSSMGHYGMQPSPGMLPSAGMGLGLQASGMSQSSGMGLGLQASASPQQAQLLMREQQQLQQLQFMEVQQFAAREQELLRGYDQQHDFGRYSGGYEGGDGGVAGNNPISAVAVSEPRSGLSLVPQQQFDNPFQMQQPLQEAEQQQPLQPLQYHHLQRAESDQEAGQHQSLQSLQYHHLQRAESDQDVAQHQLLQPLQYHHLQRAESDEARSGGDVVGPSS